VHGYLEAGNADELAHASQLLRPSDLVLAFERMREHTSSTHAFVVARVSRPLGMVSILDIVETILRHRDREKVAPFHG
jgi:hypothetical protein